MQKIQFRAYRTFRHLEHTMILLTDAQHFSGSIRGKCPSEQCIESKHRSLVCASGAPVSFCHRCRCSFDALELVARIHELSYWDAAAWLDNLYNPN